MLANNVSPDSYGERSMKLELTETWSEMKTQEQSLQVGAEEWEWTDCVKFWLALASAVVVKHNNVQKSKYNVGKSSSVLMSFNSNMQKSTLQPIKYDSLSIKCYLWQWIEPDLEPESLFFRTCRTTWASRRQR